MVSQPLQQFQHFIGIEIVDGFKRNELVLVRHDTLLLGERAPNHVIANGGITENVIHRGAEIRNERSEEHTSELQSLMRISYAVFCLTKKKKHITEEKTKNDRYK